MGGKLGRRKKIYRCCSVPEILTGLESIRGKLAQMETEMRLLSTSVRSDEKVPVLLEAFRPVLAVAEEIIPYTDGLKENQQLLADARKAFGTQVLASRMNRLVTRSMESFYYLFMGKMFYEGVSVELDYEQSAAFFKCAIKYGNSEAFSYLGQQHEFGLRMIDDEHKAFECYINGTELQDPDCLFQMEHCFETGYGDEKNEGMSFAYYKMAADFGHSGGQTQVAYCLSAGKGTEIDLEKSMKYDIAAAEAGDAHALCHLGLSMLFGTGVEKNYQVAVELFEIAISAGSDYALVRLGDCYSEGLGVEEDKEEAFRLFCEAADEGNILAFARMGMCLLIGDGVAPNVDCGMEYLRVAARRGNVYAYYTLRRCLQFGAGVEEDSKMALAFYEGAATLPKKH